MAHFTHITCPINYKNFIKICTNVFKKISLVSYFSWSASLFEISVCLLLTISYIIPSQSSMGGRNIVLALQQHKLVLPSCECMELKLVLFNNSMTSVCKKSLTSLDKPVLGSNITNSVIIFPWRFWLVLISCPGNTSPFCTAESLCCPLLPGSSGYNSLLVK